ncbi:acyclic terpene utilization AtuA family protein [Bordetella sp. LUAb4]|uniref:acyclic terpene utilization AtuA family protein n=1 Tax=Bordetella sp. LUAb4 TaxID=2843195 RepID=UPI001E640FF0|nr:acyclic terpene utilization AtuA family protein [Bordetella sp. LUAb4]
MSTTIRLGAGGGFWGDAYDPAEELLRQGKLDFMCFDFLAELTMAILHRQKKRNPDSGYVPDVLPFMTSLAPLAREHGTCLVSNGGGANPLAAGRAIADALGRAGTHGVKIGVVGGDDLMHRLDELFAQGVPLTNTATGEDDLRPLRERILCANVYAGAEGIMQAVEGGADIVVTGRVADSALFVGPILQRLGRGYDDPDLVAAAITAGHIAECAAGCTGGMSSRFDEMPHMGRVGFPIIEFESDGSAVVTKLPGTGGRVDAFTVKEHLVYEIGDPRSYAAPDGIADFTAPRLREIAPDRVRVSGCKGAGRPGQLKLLIGYADGWIGEGLMLFPWPRALERARKAQQTLSERFERMGLAADDVLFSYLGVNTLHGPAAPWPAADDMNEVGLRVAVRTRTQEEAEKVRRACTHLWIMGPGGTSFGAPFKPRPAVSLWPTTIARELVESTMEMIES